MAKPNEVTAVQVYDTWSTEPGKQPYRVKQVTFWIGAQGPFRKQFAWPDYSPEAVNAWMQGEVDNLKQIGAL